MIIFVFMLTLTSFPSSIRGALGQYQSLECNFVSDLQLSGQMLDVQVVIGANISNWRLLYPNAGGTYAMNFISGHENYQVDLIVNNDLSFDIQVRFFQTNGTGNSTFFTEGGTETMVVTPSIGGNSATCTSVVNYGIGCDLNFQLSNQADGYIPGQNLSINITSTEFLGNNMYAQLVSKTGVVDSDDVVNGLGMSYAMISDQAYNVGTLPNPCLEGFGFYQLGPYSTAQVTIDANCLIDCQEYCLNIIYQKGGVWYSCKLDLRQATTYPPIFGDISYLLTDMVGQTFNSGCIRGLVKCQTVDYCVTMDKATFDTRAAEAGLAGTFDDFFSNVTAVLGSQNGVGQSIQVVGTDSTTSYQACVNNLNIDFDHKWITFVWRFLINGQVYNIKVVVELEANGVEFEPTLTITNADGDDVTQCLCSEDETNIFIQLHETYDPSNCVVLFGENGFEFQNHPAVISFDGTQIEIDQSLLNEGKEYCYKIICSEGDLIEDCSGCDPCPPIEITFEGEVDEDGFAVLYVAQLNAANYDVQIECVSNGAPAENCTEAFPGAGVQLVSISIYDKASGCSYFFDDPDNEVQIVGIPGGTQYPFGGYLAGPYVLQPTEPYPDDCEGCEEEPTSVPCESIIAPSVMGECTDDGQIQLTFTDGNLFDINSDSGWECSTDGVNYSPCPADGLIDSSTVHVKRCITFNNCPSINVQQSYDCGIGRPTDEECQNTVSLLVAENGDGTFDLDVSGTYTSSNVQESICVTVGDFTEEYFAFPITLNIPEGLNVSAIAKAVFDDGCPDVQSDREDFVEGLDPNQDYDCCCTIELEFLPLCYWQLVGDCCDWNIAWYQGDGSTDGVLIGEGQLIDMRNQPRGMYYVEVSKFGCESRRRYFYWGGIEAGQGNENVEL